MAELNAYEILAFLKTRQNTKQKFSTIITANSQNDAEERILSQIGSRHKIPRRFINIQKIQKLNDEQGRRYTEGVFSASND